MMFKRARVTITLWPEDGSSPYEAEMETEEEEGEFDEAVVEFLIMELVSDALMNEFPPLGPH